MAVEDRGGVVRRKKGLAARDGGWCPCVPLGPPPQDSVDGGSAGVYLEWNAECHEDDNGRLRDG